VKEDSVVEYRNPGVALPVAYALTEVLRSGARELLQQAVEGEVAEFLARHRELKDERARQRVVRNGYKPERTIQPGIGDVVVKAPQVRDRAGAIKFHSSIVPAYLRRTRSIEELLPWLYLKGLSTGDFASALTALLGKDAPGLSPATISRLKEVWKGEYERWAKRDLTGKEYVYLWAGGVHFGVRLEDASQCILVVIGATADGKKGFLAMLDGYRESEASWKELLLGVQQRGLTLDPKVAVGDGALGSGRPCHKSSAPRANNVAGCTRQPTCSTTYPRVSKRKPKLTSTRSGWPRVGLRQHKPWPTSWLPMKRNIRRPPSAWPRTGTPC